MDGCMCVCVRVAYLECLCAFVSEVGCINARTVGVFISAPSVCVCAPYKW